jgi:RNA polymerase sigma factor (sigma-70 family)
MGAASVSRSSEEIYDELLVTRCRRRDLAAWNELVGRWSDRLLYYLRRLIDHEQDATNALQEVWMSALRGMHNLRDNARLAPWLYTIARRTATNHYRLEYGRREEATSEAAVEMPCDAVDEQLQFENAELVHHGLKQLGLPEREVLTLFFLEDLSVGEIADLLGIPAGTVKSRMFKARANLRRILEREAAR